MTDVQETTSVTAEATAEVVGDDTKRGRPRPADTITRDNTVFDGITEAGNTRQELATALGMSGDEVYLSLYRLRKAGRIERSRDGGRHVWRKASAQPTPA